jgi:single-strand DNA-binding protein
MKQPKQQPEAKPAYDTQNEVRLRGTLADVPLERLMPSGDQMCSFRVNVARPPGTRVRVDSIDCASTRAAVRRLAMKSTQGQVVEVTGSLHRRFWRATTGLASRYEVQVTSLKVIRAAGRRTAG